MSTYLWSGKDRNGQKFVLRIQADSVKQARTELQGRGCTELELHTDEVVGELIGRSADLQAISAEKHLEYRDQGAGTWKEFIGRTLREQAWIQAVLLVAVALQIYRGRAVGVALILVIMVLLFALRLYQARPVIEVAKLYSAREWHRWPEVLTRVARLERINASGRITLPAFELARCRALALAGMGRIAEAEKLLSDARTRDSLPEWLHLHMSASVYDAAKDHDKATETVRQALELGPVNQSARIDLAFRLALYTKDAPAARSVLATVEQHDLMDLAKPGLWLCEGVVADVEGKFHEAKQHLDEALRGFKKFSQMHLIEGSIHLTEAFLCCVCAQLGDLSSARTYLDNCRDFLRATEADELLQRCETAVLHAQSRPSASTAQSRAE
jgi:tetratricopeptide (TPR) repeat protein